MLSAHVLEKNNVIPIVCNISPFESLRDFAREKFDDYNEIFLQKNLEIAKNNDVKGVYKENLMNTSLVGIDLIFEEPKHSNLVLEVDKETVDVSFNKILDYLEDR